MTKVELLEAKLAATEELVDAQSRIIQCYRVGAIGSIAKALDSGAAARATLHELSEVEPDE